MKVHHLNCGSLYPYGCGELVCHVMLIETGNGLALIDTGLGPKDCLDPAKRVGPSRYLIRPVLKREEAAVNQVERLGFRRDDVRHIVITHFDGDHIGGVCDFPEGQIHVTAAEALGAMSAPSRSERFRYRAVQWAHGPKMHCGDAFFHDGTVDGTARMPRALAAFESVTAFDRKMMRENDARLAELYRRREPDMLMVCSHDRTQYVHAQATA